MPGLGKVSCAQRTDGESETLRRQLDASSAASASAWSVTPASPITRGAVECGLHRTGPE